MALFGSNGLPHRSSLSRWSSCLPGEAQHAPLYCGTSLRSADQIERTVWEESKIGEVFSSHRE